MNIEFTSSIFVFLDLYVRPFFFFFASGFAIYFSYLKLSSDRLEVSYSVISRLFSAERISNLVIQNKRDKVVIVYSVSAVFDNNRYLELIRFNKPLVIKPFECVSIEAEEYSYLCVDEDKRNLDYFNCDIVIESNRKLIKCVSSRRESLHSKYKVITKVKNSFSDFVYDKSVKYIFLYHEFGDSGRGKVAFISKDGFIGNEWDFSFNHLGGCATADQFLSAIKSDDVKDRIRSFTLFEVDEFGKRKIVKQWRDVSSNHIDEQGSIKDNSVKTVNQIV